jgi:hypothetical protein
MAGDIGHPSSTPLQRVLDNPRAGPRLESSKDSFATDKRVELTMQK